MAEHGFSGTPTGYSGESRGLDKKSSADAQTALDAMKRRIAKASAYKDDTGSYASGPGTSDFPGAT